MACPPAACCSRATGPSRGKRLTVTLWHSNPACCLLPIPSQEAREGGISRERISREVIPLIRQVAKSTNSKVIDLNKVMKDKEGLLVDGVHPNAEGHALMAEHILLVLKGKAAE